MPEQLSSLHPRSAQLTQPAPSLFADIPARGAVRAQELSTLLPQELPPLYLGQLKAGYSLVTPLVALSPRERTRLSPNSPSEDISSALITLPCLPQSLAADSAVSLLELKLPQAVVFELMPRGESLMAVEVRPVNTLGKYEFLALLWAYNLSFIEHSHAPSLLTRPHLGAPLGDFLAQQLRAYHAAPLACLDLIALSAIYVNANTSLPQQRFELSALLLHSPWRYVLNATVTPGPTPQAARLRGSYDALRADSLLPPPRAQLPLSTPIVAQISTLRSSLRQQPISACLGAKPNLITDIVLYLAAHELALSPAPSLNLSCAQLWAHYLAALSEDSSVSARVTALDVVYALLAGPEATPLGGLTAVALVLSLLYPERDADFERSCAALAQHGTDRLTLTALAPQLELSPERVAIALNYGLTELTCCTDLTALEPLITAQLAVVPEELSSAQLAAHAITPHQAAPSLLQSYLTFHPERLNALLQTQPELLAAGLNALADEQQAAVLAQLTTPDAQVWAEFLGQALAPEVLSALAATLKAQPLCAELIAQLKERAADASVTATRALSALSALCAELLMQPEHMPLWTAAHDALPLLGARTPESMAEQVSACLQHHTALAHLLTDRPELNTVLQGLAQGLLLVTCTESKTALSAHPEYLEQWLTLVDAIGPEQVAAALEGSTWSGALLAHATTPDLRRRCLDLIPARALGHISLHQLEPLLPELSAQQLETKLDPKLWPKLHALLDALLATNLSAYSGSDLALVQQLITLNLSVNPDLYHELIATAESPERLGLVITNLMVLGRRVREVSSAVVAQLRTLSSELRARLRAAQELPSLGGAPNVLGALLEGLVGAQLGSPDGWHWLTLLNHKYCARCIGQHSAEFEQLITHPDELPELELMATLLAQFIIDRPNAPQVKAWLAPLKAHEALRTALAYALTQALSAESKLLALDPNDPVSLTLLELLPQPLRLAHAALFTHSPLAADWAQRELQPLIAQLSTARTAAATHALALLGLSSTDPVLALCCALSTPKLREAHPALTTALLAAAPNDFLAAVTTLSEPEWTPLKELITHQLYQAAPSVQPWVGDYQIGLAHHLGCTVAHLPATLSSCLIVGTVPEALAALTPLLPLTERATPDPTVDLQSIVQARLERSEALALSPADFTHPGKFLLYGAVAAIAPSAPALAEVLHAHLKGAPAILALSALPPVITAALSAPSVLASDQAALAALIVTAADLNAAHYPVAAHCSAAELEQMTAEALSAYHLLLVGLRPEVMTASLVPQPLAQHLSPLYYHQHGRADLALALEQYSEQLNVLSAPTSQALLELHGAQPDQGRPDLGRVIATRSCDGTISLYTLAQSNLGALLSAAAACDPLKLEPEPIKLTLVSTNEPPHGAALGAESADERLSSALARDLEQGSADPGLLAARCRYSTRLRARHFATQVALLAQLAHDLPLYYIIEYERDLAPLQAYLSEQYPQLAAKTTLLSLSALLPQALCSDLVQAPPELGVLADEAMVVINGLELSAHLDLAEASNQQGVAPSFATLGLNALPQVELQPLSPSAWALVLLHGLMGELARHFGPQCTYYLLEPSLNDGFELRATEAPLLSSVQLELRYLKPFASREAKFSAQEQAQPFFALNSDATTSALQTLEAMASSISSAPESAPKPKPASSDPARTAQAQLTALQPESSLRLNKAQGEKVLALLAGEGEASKLEVSKALRAISHMFIEGHEWRSYQKTALPALLKRTADALISLPTGGGKSVLFQGPAWYRSFYSGRLSVVITPLRALMVDQVLALHDKNYLSVDYMSADRPSYEMRQVMERVRSGVTTLLYITPERLRSRYFVKLLKERYEQDGKQGEYFIFDEAHCISQWGKEFRPDYIYAAKLIAELRAEYDFSVVMCSATMTTQVITDLEQYLRPNHLLLGEIGTNYNPIRPHIGLSTQQVPSDLNARVAAIITFIRSQHIDFAQSRMLIFCQLRHSTEDVCLALESYAEHLHYLYRYQQRHPGLTFEPVPLTEVLARLNDQPAPLFESESDNQAERAQLSAQEQEDLSDAASTSLGAEAEVQDNERYGQVSSLDELFVPEAKEPASSTFTYAPHELCCDLTNIPADDPLLQLKGHVGFFHAQMSARAREHVFTRYKENDARIIAAQVKNRHALWFNDNVASLERGAATEQSMLTSNQPLYVLCSTKAFGMGMDLPNIHYVLHATPSGVFEDYLQEVGRAGRSQAQYEAAFPLDPATGARALLPAICLYHQEDFDQAMERLNKSLISWDQIMLADELVRAYVARFGPLPEAVTTPVVVPSDLFARSVEQVLTPSDPENISNKAMAHNSTLLFYHLEDMGRIKLGFRAPCPLQLTLHRPRFTKIWEALQEPNAVLTFAYNDELHAGSNERSDARLEWATRCVMVVLHAQLRNFDAAYHGHEDEDITPVRATNEPELSAATDLPEQVALIFDLQYFLQQCNHNAPLKQRLTLASTVNALIELMASGALTLHLPFSLSFNLGQGADYPRRFNQAEVQYYLSKYETVPALSAPVLPHLNLTLRLGLTILERSYEHCCAQPPTADDQGLAFTNQWLLRTLRELLEPYAQDLATTGFTNPPVPWVSSRKRDLNYYLEHHLLPDVTAGVSALLQLMPQVKLTKVTPEHGAGASGAGTSGTSTASAGTSGASTASAGTSGEGALIVKTWSDAFYLMLDLLYEDSWRLLTELNRTSGLNPVTTTAVTFASLAQGASTPEPTITVPSILSNWAELVFALGLRHESSEALLNNYELTLARNHARAWFQELKSELSTYSYFQKLLSLLQAIGLVRHSALISYGYELTLTAESVSLALDSASSIESPFFQRKQNFEALAQFKRARLALMQVYCQEVPDAKRRLFIEEFFKSKDYGDYIKHIGNFSDANSSILSEITASTLALAEEQLRANPEQWAVYQSPADLSLNVMAGPGSGKTHLLALRCVRLIYHDHVAPEAVLILAYNRAVVVELKTRLDRLFTNLGLRKIGRKLAIFTFHSLAKVCLGSELNELDPQDWECTLIARLKAQPQLFIKRFAALRYIMIDEFQDITHARLELLHLLKQCYRTPLYLFTIGDINQSIYGFNRVANMLQDPSAQAATGYQPNSKPTLSAAEYAACLGPEPYYRDLQRLFEPSTMSLKLNYRSFPQILARAAPYALNPNYTSCSAPLLTRYAPQDVGYCALFDVTAAAAQRAQHGTGKLRAWEQDLGNILRFVHQRNEQAQVLAREAAAQLGLQDSEASARYEQLIFAAAALSANSAAAQKDHPDTAHERPPQVPRPQSADELLLQSKYRQVESIALFFRTNNEVYRALAQIRALPEEVLAEVEVRLQSASSVALWREREFYALCHFIKRLGTEKLNLSTQLMLTKEQSTGLALAHLEDLSLDQLYAQLTTYAQREAAQALKLLTQSLMARYPNWDQVRLDMAYCLALSFSATMMTGLDYTWADLYEYYTDLLSKDDGGQCYKLYESMARHHLVAQKRVSLTLSTMHKVKGLEYDMVIIPPSSADLPLLQHDYVRAEPNQLRFEPNRYYSYEQALSAAQSLPLGQDEQADLAEERCLYYVAYTRARKFLYVYYGERERALDAQTRYLNPENTVLWSENDDSLDNYVISFNATAARSGANDYLARMVKPHDAVLLVAQGEQCYIQHQAASPYGAPWFTIGRLSQKSKLRAQMLTHHVNYLSGLFINNIVAWTYEDTVQSDIKRLQEALAEQGQLDLEEAEPDLSDPQVRASLAHSLNLTLYASYWAPETRARGYCYLVTLAGRGTPH